MSDDDRDLLSAARAGDRTALEALVSKHEARIYSFGLKMCRDSEDAREVLQDTLLAMLEHVDDFRGDAAFTTWLFAVARSQCARRRRRSKHAPPTLDSLDDAPHLAAEVRSPDEQAAGAELRARLDAAIDALDPISREVLVLRDIEGLRAGEVAAALSMGVPAVKSRLHRARIAVRDALADTPEPTSPACPDILGAFSRHLEGDIGPADCARMEAHLQTCPRCTVVCSSLRQTLALCKATARAEVPPDVQQTVRVALRDFLARR